MFEKGLVQVKGLVKGINWQLLVFLLLFSNVKLVVKVIAVVFIYLMQPDFKFKVLRKSPDLTWFYCTVMIIAVLNYLLYSNYSTFNYSFTLITGLGFWLLCILSLHQIELAVKLTKPEAIHRTVQVFFSINAIVSIIDLLIIIAKIHRVNPYSYQGDFQKYFLNTGDYIKGITFDVSVTNAVMCAFGVVYFLLRDQVKMMLVCMCTLLLTASNIVNIMLFFSLVVVFIFRSTKAQKSLIVVCFMLLVTFMVKVTPQNMYYIDKMYNKVVFNKSITFDSIPVKQRRITDIPDRELNAEQRKEKIAQLYLDTLTLKLKKKEPDIIKVKPAAVFVLPKDSIHTAKFQSRSGTDAAQRSLLSFIHAHQNHLKLSSMNQQGTLLPGKVIAAKQTIEFFKQHPQRLATGDGMGNFSSKLAFRTTSLGLSGGYPHKLAYVGSDFLPNHLDIYLNFFSKRAGMHSVIHSPDNTYDQLLSEYGLAGLLSFLLLYVGYFLKHYRYLTYGLPLMLLMCGLFSMAYWFEQLSVVVLFELLMLVNIREQQLKQAKV